MERKYTVYIRIDENNLITKINSDAFISDFTGWTAVESGTGDRFHHAQGNYLPLGLTDIEGIHNYKYADGAVIERTEEEKEKDRTAVLLPKMKEQLITDSKLKLARWLIDNPMLFTDGKYYSVTEEKQTLLNGNLASYERATKADIPYSLKWNSTGDESVEWQYADLLSLSLSIAEYVAPKVAAQQAIETAIKACSEIEELKAVVISYD